MEQNVKGKLTFPDAPGEIGRGEGSLDNETKNLVGMMDRWLFAGVADFVAEVLRSDYDYKILMSRRYFDLHASFAPIVSYLNDGVEERGTFVSNLSFVAEDLSGKTVLVVDDTLVHGRAIGILLEELEKLGCKRENIAVRVFAHDKDAKLADSSLEEKIQCESPLDGNTYRGVAGKIVNSFMVAGQPYVSYLPYYQATMGSAAADGLLRFVKENGLEDYASAVQKEYGVASYLYFEKTNFCLSRKEMIRIYVYEKAKKVVMVPYAFLKPLSYRQVAELFRFLSEEGLIAFDGNAAFLTDERKMKDIDTKGRYGYCVLTYLISLLLGMAILERYGIRGCERGKAVEEISLRCHPRFGQESASELIGRIQKKAAGLGIIAADEIRQEEDEDMAWVLQRVGEKTDGDHAGWDPEFFLNRYLRFSNERDETLAGQDKKRMQGISMESLWRHMKDGDRSWRQVIGKIDLGQGTIAVAPCTINGEAFLDSLLYAGEQSHTCNEENLAHLIYPLIQYGIYCRNRGIPKETEERNRSCIAEEILRRNTDLGKSIGEDEREAIVKGSYEKHWEYYMDKYFMFRGIPGVRNALRVEKRYET